MNDMKIVINITKNQLAVFSFFLLMVISVLAWAYNTGNPNYVGHTADEIFVVINGTMKTLQEAIDDESFNILGANISLENETKETISGDWDGGDGFGGRYLEAICPEGYVVVGVGVYSPHEGGHLTIICRKIKLR